MSAVFTSLEQCQAALTANGFAVFVVRDMTCATTGRCHDCNSPQRICNTWSIFDKCFPVGRIKVVLIEEEWGL